MHLYYSFTIVIFCLFVCLLVCLSLSRDSCNRMLNIICICNNVYISLFHIVKSRVRMRIQCVKGDSSGINRTMDKVLSVFVKERGRKERLREYRRKKVRKESKVLSVFEEEKKEKVSESGYTG